MKIWQTFTSDAINITSDLFVENFPWPEGKLLKERWFPFKGNIQIYMASSVLLQRFVKGYYIIYCNILAESTRGSSNTLWMKGHCDVTKWVVETVRGSGWCGEAVCAERNHTYLAGKRPWSRRWFFQDEASPLHFGCADACDVLKCGILDCKICGSGGLRSRSPLALQLKLDFFQPSSQMCPYNSLICFEY